MTGAVQVRTATESDIPEMAAMMGRTFQDGDAVGEFMFPDPAQRQVRQRRMFQALMKYRYVPERRADVAVADNGKIVGVVLWDRSWTRPHVGRKVAENIALLVAMRSRVVAGLMVEAAAARGAPKERHLYVMYIGVDPDWHGYAPLGIWSAACGSAPTPNAPVCTATVRRSCCRSTPRHSPTAGSPEPRRWAGTARFSISCTATRSVDRNPRPVSVRARRRQEDRCCSG